MTRATLGARFERMRRGAIALIDALGFRGIWTRKDTTPDAVLQKLRELRTAANAVVSGFHARLNAIKPHGALEPKLDVSFLSDSIVVSAVVDGKLDQVRKDWGSLLLVSYATSAITALAAKYPPTLAYRGAIAHGEFEVDGPFIIGRAVDEAASNESLAEAAIVWFAPSAESVIRTACSEHGAELGESHLWLEWDVPLKGGARYRTHAVTPYLQLKVSEPDMEMTLTTADVETLQGQILATFDESRVDIAVKKQNTKAFLEAAAKRVT